MVATFPSSIFLLLNEIEALYKMTLSLAEESAEIETEIDRQIAIEEIRKANLEKVDLIFEEVISLLAVEGMVQEQINEEAFLHQKERLLQLLDRIHYIDKRRTAKITEEQSVLIASLQDLHLGKQAVLQYQKAIPTES